MWRYNFLPELKCCWQCRHRRGTGHRCLRRAGFGRLRAVCAERGWHPVLAPLGLAGRLRVGCTRWPGSRNVSGSRAVSSVLVLCTCSNGSSQRERCGWCVGAVEAPALVRPAAVLNPPPCLGIGKAASGLLRFCCAVLRLRGAVETPALVWPAAVLNPPPGFGVGGAVPLLNFDNAGFKLRGCPGCTVMVQPGVGSYSEPGADGGAWPPASSVVSASMSSSQAVRWWIIVDRSSSEMPS